MKANIILYQLLCLLAIHTNAQDMYFPPIGSDEWETVDPQSLGWCEDRITEFLDHQLQGQSKAVIILKNGKIALENYFDGHDVNANWYWASAGKSLTAALLGVAQQDGILNIEDYTSEYLGDEWSVCPEAVDNIKIRHHLTMTTGLDYTVPNIGCILPECLLCLNEPDQEWFYHNAPYTLIGDILSAASGKSLNNYTSQTLGASIGLNGLWVTIGDDVVFFSKARTMARFGTLMLANGNWDGTQVLSDPDYFQSMVTPSQDINPAYGYLWWLNGQEKFRLPSTTFDFPGMLLPDAPSDIYAAIGKNGQFLIVIPSENTVIIRMGNSPDDNPVTLIFLREMLNLYQNLSCPTAVDDLDDAQPMFYVYPKLATDFISIDGVNPKQSISLYDRQGKLVLRSNYEFGINIQSLNNGIYFIRMIIEGRVYTDRFIKS